MFMDVDPYGGAEDPYNVYTGYDEPICGDPWENYENLAKMEAAAAARATVVITPLQMLQPTLAASKATTGGLRRQRANDSSVGSLSITSAEDLSSDESGPDNGVFYPTNPTLTPRRGGGEADVQEAGMDEAADSATDDSDAGSASASWQDTTGRERKVADDDVAREDDELKPLPFDDDLLADGLMEIF